MIDPKNDGVTHVNIYSKGKTELGRSLTNFASMGAYLNCPLFKQKRWFASLEAYWYYLKSDQTENSYLYLCNLTGFKAKEKGKDLSLIKQEHFEDEDFKILFKKAIQDKIVYNKSYFYPALKLNLLPFTHYYVYGDKVVEAGYPWITEEITRISSIIKIKDLK